MIAHLYLFSDASPSDWLVDGQNDEWHTIVNFIFHSDPAAQPFIDSGLTHEEVLSHDRLYNEFIAQLQAKLPSRRLRKWNAGTGYQKRFCMAFAGICSRFKPMVSACFFQEKTLRASKNALLNSYN